MQKFARALSIGFLAQTVSPLALARMPHDGQEFTASDVTARTSVVDMAKNHEPTPPTAPGIGRDRLREILESTISQCDGKNGGKLDGRLTGREVRVALANVIREELMKRLENFDERGQRVYRSFVNDLANRIERANPWLLESDIILPLRAGNQLIRAAEQLGKLVDHQFPGGVSAIEIDNLTKDLDRSADGRVSLDELSEWLKEQDAADPKFSKMNAALAERLTKTVEYFIDYMKRKNPDQVVAIDHR